MSQFPYETRVYEILPYDPDWPVRFSSIEEKLKEIFGPDALDIQHIGSTSVPGMDGKATIDVLVVVSTEDKLESHKDEMETAGYLYQGQVITEGSRLYRDANGDDIYANIHIFPEGHPHNAEMIRLRDYLRAHPEDVKEYSQLKKDLKEKYPNDYAGYRKEKDVYVDSLLKKLVGL